MISLSYECDDMTEEMMEVITRRGARVVLCHEMDICYDVGEGENENKNKNKNN